MHISVEQYCVGSKRLCKRAASVADQRGSKASSKNAKHFIRSVSVSNHGLKRSRSISDANSVRPGKRWAVLLNADTAIHILNINLKLRRVSLAQRFELGQVG